MLEPEPRNDGGDGPAFPLLKREHTRVDEPEERMFQAAIFIC
jgi:hypothetical protein